MGLSGKLKNTTNNEGWGLGLFLVFFPENDDKPDTTNTTNKLLSTHSLFSSFANANHQQLFYKAQSTISVCVILVIFTLLLFTLSNFDSAISQTPQNLPRRWLSDQTVNKKAGEIHSSSSALQGMGTLFRRGTRSMSDLIVVHLPQNINHHHFRIFLRTLHLSGVTSRADLVIIADSFTTATSRLIHQENASFMKLVFNSSTTFLDLNHFKKERSPGGETLWGKKIHTSNTSNNNSENNKLTYGSVVGFEVSELDPADSLSGFLEHTPIRLRRWACYPMLLGRLRRSFKHIMLVDANEVIPLGDSLAKVRHKAAESVHFWRNSDKTRSHDKKDSKLVTSDVIVGGMRGIRLLSNAMLNEIVRVSLKKKSKNPISDSVILSQIVNNESLLKSLSIETSVESALASANSVVSLVSSTTTLSSMGMLRRDSNNQSVDVNYILHTQICTSVRDTFIYKDCYKRGVV